jgi:transcriptional regulator with XRE-family HTH domain
VGVPLMADYPNNLRRIRKNHTDKHLRSGTKVAELLGVTPQYYYDLEKGKRRLHAEQIAILSQIFSCPADEILKVPGQNLVVKYGQRIAGKSIITSEILNDELKKLAGTDKAWGQLREEAESADISPDELRAMLEALRKIKKPGN